MRVRTMWLVPVLVVVLVPRAWAQGAGEGGGDTPPAAMEHMLPGPEHEALGKLAGTWSVTTKMWMDPSQPPMESIGTAEFKLIMDGRFVQQEYNGEMMGMPLTGVGFQGFDRVTGKYTSYWMSSMSTSPTWLTGTSNDGGKTVEYTGEMADWMSGSTVKARWVDVHASDDESHVEMFVTRGDKEEKVMELDYKRKQQ